MTKYNIWFFGSLIVAAVVAMPIITVFFSFFYETTNYFYILKETFLLDYIFNSIIILLFVIFFTFILGIFSAYFVSFYDFPLSNFFSWALILSFAVPGYIYAFSIIAFFENYGTAFSLLTFLFGENNYNPIIPKIDPITKPFELLKSKLLVKKTLKFEKKVMNATAKMTPGIA